ncbi:MAG: right-handed parallel beta-helix repeat-containing protein [candidate division Zixibacteria bacterium]|nr:right-handed parallel beta-helix repeat-containing protein [candidate division Zixibacteria bacterium]
MKKTIISILAISMFFACNAWSYQSLQEVFDDASAGGGYDKLLILDPEIEYEGGLFIDAGLTAGIMGFGAKIFIPSDREGIEIYDSKLDITECVLIGGQAALYYQQNAYGKVYNNTIVGSAASGIICYYQNDDSNLVIYNNIISDCYYGIWGIEENLPSYIDYNIVYNSTVFNYAQYCPG